MSTGILIGLGAIVIVFAVIVGLYNALVRGKNMVEEAWSSIDVQLKRRHDLVPNLVSAVRQYASHEKGLFEEVSAARARSLSIQGDVAAQAKAESMLSGALSKLFAIAEAYPELRASENYQQLQQSLARLKTKFRWPAAITTAQPASRTTAFGSFRAILWPDSFTLCL